MNAIIRLNKDISYFMPAADFYMCLFSGSSLKNKSARPAQCFDYCLFSICSVVCSVFYFMLMLFYAFRIIFRIPFFVSCFLRFIQRNH